MRSLLTVSFAALLAVIPFSAVFAQMTSSSYRLYGDAIVGQGGDSSSASYSLEATSGEAAPGVGSSASYNMLSGFQELSEHPTFTFSISGTSLNVGTATTGNVASDSLVLTTSTNADFGYVTTVVEDGELRSGANDIDDVADGTVSAGDEEYGIGVSGTDAAFGDHRAISTTPLTVASRSNWKAEAQVTVTHYVAASSVTVPGTYAHTVTYVSTGTF